MAHIIRNVINFVRKKYAHKQFVSSASIGCNFICYENARCINESGNKNNITIGDNVSILGTIISEADGKIHIGDYTTIRGGTRVAATDSIFIGDYVIISNHVVIMDNNSHPIEVEQRKKMSLSMPGTELWKSKYSRHTPVVIDDSVWVGERAVILKGVHVGKGSIIACDSVVVHDVPEYCIVAGNPAVVVKQITGAERNDN